MAKDSLSWKSLTARSPWLVSPRLPRWQRKIVSEMRRRAPREAEMFWILSSGTQSVDEVKAIGLTHEAVLTSAEAVNIHLWATMKDRWLLALPLHHVGGLGVLARAHLSGSRVFQLPKWDARAFIRKIKRAQITLTSLVPTQVFDLARADLQAPQGLRAVVVGGGALDHDLYARARELGWPLLPSYGLSECSSQVATATLSSLKHEVFPAFKVLPHVQVRLYEQKIALKSESLCRWIARADRTGQFTMEDPTRDGWFATEDMAEWVGKYLRVHGRRDDIVKIFGELVPLALIEARARLFFRKRGLRGELAVAAVPGGRAGHRLVLITDSSDSLAKWDEHLTHFNKTLNGPQRLRQFCWVPEIPRGELGKVKKAELLSQLRL